MKHRIGVKVAKEAEQSAILSNEMAESLQNTMRSLDCFHSVIQSITDFLIGTDSDGTIRTVNKAALHLLGYEEKELIGKSIETIFAAEERGVFIDRHCGQSTNEVSPANSEVTCMTKGGRSIPVLLLGVVLQAKAGKEIPTEVSAPQIKDSKGNVVDIVFLFHDISERKRAEKALRESAGQLRQAQKMKVLGQLAGGIAHDLCNLLTIIQGFAELALMNAQEDTAVYRNLSEIRKASTHCGDLTRQLFLFSHRRPMDFTRLDLSRAVDNSIQTLKHLIGKDISLTTDLGTVLWTINGNDEAIEQVITSLLMNARDAMPNGGEIEIQTKNVMVNEDYCKTRPDASPGRFVSLSIQDTGEGIGHNIINRIFEPFFSTREMEKRSGLGLSVVYAIVREHKGWIEVKSSPGEGANLTVFLPAVCTTPEDRQKTPISLKDFRGNGQRILVVEDKDSIREAVEEMLLENEYIVFSAGNTLEALDIFKKEKGDFDLIFIDMILPDESGTQLVQRLLKLKPGIRVLLSSGYSEGKWDWPDIQQGEYSYLKKPFSLADLLRSVSCALAGEEVKQTSEMSSSV